MKEYLVFDRFITPVIIQILFWVLLAVTVISGLYMITQGAGVQGILVILLGPILLRVYTEILMVAFKMLEELQDIRRQGENRP